MQDVIPLGQGTCIALFSPIFQIFLMPHQKTVRSGTDEELMPHD